jgi:hypothetical protein
MDTVFVAKGSNRYSLQIEPEGTKDLGGKVVPIPAVVIAFEGGTYSTSDPKRIEAIRETEAFKAGRVFQLAMGEEAPKQKLPDYIRGAISTKSIHKEADVEEPADPAMSLKEKGISKCLECPKEFTEDYSGAKLRGHMISHRRGKNPLKPTRKDVQSMVEAKKTAEEIKIKV